MKVIDRATNILDSWGRLTSRTANDNLSDEDRMHQALLEKAQREYRELYMEQQVLLGDQKFSRIVAAAMANMPRARRLEFHDTDIFGLGKRPLVGCQDIRDPIYANLLLPMPGDHATGESGEPPIEILTELPAALGDAGIQLDSIVIDLSSLQSPAKMVPSPELRQRLDPTVRHLREFSFKVSDIWELPADSPDNGLGKILSPYLDSSSCLERLHLSLDLLEDDEDPDWMRLSDVGRVLTSRAWPNLSHLTLSNVALRLSDLELFMKKLDQSLISAFLDRIYLLEGTWAEALDAMRGKFVSVSLSDPLGAECNDMPFEDYVKVFRQASDSAFDRSKAEINLRGGGSHTTRWRCRRSIRTPRRAQLERLTLALSRRPLEHWFQTLGSRETPSSTSLLGTASANHCSIRPVAPPGAGACLSWPHILRETLPKRPLSAFPFFPPHRMITGRRLPRDHL
ncbi:hypothetical protein VTK56DRAFT_4860 [Thermocarpiscus australiensis]